MEDIHFRRNKIAAQAPDQETSSDEIVYNGDPTTNTLNNKFPFISSKKELLQKLKIFSSEISQDNSINIDNKISLDSVDNSSTGRYIRTYQYEKDGQQEPLFVEEYDSSSKDLVHRTYHVPGSKTEITEEFLSTEDKENIFRQYISMIIVDTKDGRDNLKKIDDSNKDQNSVKYTRFYTDNRNLKDLRADQIINAPKQQTQNNQCKEQFVNDNKFQNLFSTLNSIFLEVEDDKIHGDQYLKNLFQYALQQSSKKMLIKSINFPHTKDGLPSEMNPKTQENSCLLVCEPEDYRKIIKKAIEEKTNEYESLTLVLATMERNKELTTGHAFLFILAPDDSKIYCFDSSQVFIKKYKKKLNITPLNDDNIQINGCCLYWSTCLAKAILDNAEKYPDKKAIKNGFKNQDIILDACVEMSKIFDKEGQETIKKADKSPDEANYIRLGDSSYWLHKNYKNNRFVEPEYLEKVLELKNPQHNKLQNIRSNQKTLDSEFKEINDSIQQQQLSIYQRMRRFYNKSLKIPHIISQINKDYKKIYERDNNMPCIEFQFNGDNNEITICNLKQSANKSKSFKLGNSEGYKQMHEILHMSPINIEKALEPFQDKTQADGTQVILPNPDDLDKRKKEDNMKSRQSPVSNSKNPFKTHKKQIYPMF